MTTKYIDWIALWRQLSERNNARKIFNKKDHWQDNARKFALGVKERWSKPDSSRDFILSIIKPDHTVLDIGAGTGAWSILMAPHVKHVTAIEPSPAMLTVMQENLKNNHITNIDIIQGFWPEVEVKQHTISLCSHSMYGVPDFPKFIHCMEKATQKTCVLIMRIPTPDGIMAEAAYEIFGHTNDSPNFIVAYNALLQMGIYANVLIENSGFWKPWAHDTLEEALQFIKDRLILTNTKHDAFLLTLLKKHLTYQDGKYIWPPGVRTALIHWSPSKNQNSCS